MVITKLLQKAEKFEIQSYRKTRNLKDLKKTHVGFTGSLLKHPTDPDVVVLMAEPFGGGISYYEFKMEDIGFIEELQNIVTGEGKTVALSRVWIKKMSIGIRCSPFLVEDISLKKK